MLDAFIIEELRRREEQERSRSDAERPVLEAPEYDPRPSRNHDQEEEERGKRGVVVIDI